MLKRWSEKISRNPKTKTKNQKSTKTENVVFRGKFFEKNEISQNDVQAPQAPPEGAGGTRGARRRR